MATPSQNNPQTAANGGPPGSSTSHMMKTTKRSKPFLKDTHDLFATLVVSLELATHKQYFKTFTHSFTTDEAATNLSNLKFSQSNRTPDPRDPTRIVTTTTTTTFSMTRDMAKSMCQHFMDARLIENAADRTSNLFKERGVYQLTPKGLHILERFISKNGISADHLYKVFSSQPICMKLLHLERRASDDEIIVTPTVVTALFRRFAGRQPNYIDETALADAAAEYYERSKGIPLSDVQDRAPQLIGRGPLQTFRYCFPAVTAVEWLCDMTSICGRDEASEMAAHFVRLGYIALLSDKRKGNEHAIIFTVRDHNARGQSGPQGEFRCTAKAIYRITEEGARIVQWNSRGGSRDSPSASTTNVTLTADTRPSTDHSSEGVDAVELAYGPGAPQTSPPSMVTATDSTIQRRMSIQDRLKDSYNEGASKQALAKESNADRLKYILEEPALRSLFREFLRGNYCEENLSFWLEVQDFKRKFHLTSSAMSTGARAQGASAIEKHHDRLISMAIMIYNTYLKASSPCELNIDHGLRNQLEMFLTQSFAESGQRFDGKIGLEQMHAFNATQLQKVIEYFEMIQSRIFLLMADDSIPKFVKTKRFLSLRSYVEEFESAESGPNTMFSGPPPGLEDTEQVGRTYVTVSQQANERIRPKTAPKEPVAPPAA